MGEALLPYINCFTFLLLFIRQSIKFLSFFVLPFIQGFL